MRIYSPADKMSVVFISLKLLFKFKKKNLLTRIFLVYYFSPCHQNAGKSFNKLLSCLMPCFPSLTKLKFLRYYSEVDCRLQLQDASVVVSTILKYFYRYSSADTILATFSCSRQSGSE